MQQHLLFSFIFVNCVFEQTTQRVQCVSSVHFTFYTFCLSCEGMCVECAIHVCLTFVASDLHRCRKRRSETLAVAVALTLAHSVSRYLITGRDRGSAIEEVNGVVVRYLSFVIYSTIKSSQQLHCVALTVSRYCSRCLQSYSIERGEREKVTLVP